MEEGSGFFGVVLGAPDAGLVALLGVLGGSGPGEVGGESPERGGPFGVGQHPGGL